jgi:SPFH domain / Band 7 family
MTSRTDNRYKPVDHGIDPHAHPFSQNRKDEKIQELSTCISGLWHAIFCCCMPFTCCCAIKNVKPMHDTIVTQCGVPLLILRKQGPHCVGFCCTETRDVYMGLETIEIKQMVAADDHGSPLVVTAQFVYRIQDSRAAAFRTQHLEKFLYEQAESALRAVVGMYPYDIDRNDEDHKTVTTKKSHVSGIDDDESILVEDDDGAQALPAPSLAKHSTVIDGQLVKVLQEMVDFAGVKIETFRLISVGYPKEMEKLLLARQEAQAQVTARKTIAEGSAGIIGETLSRLKALGIKLSEADQSRFAQNLTLLMVNHGHTTINIFDGGNTPSENRKQH